MALKSIFVFLITVSILSSCGDGKCGRSFVETVKGEPCPKLVDQYLSTPEEISFAFEDHTATLTNDFQQRSTSEGNDVTTVKIDFTAQDASLEHSNAGSIIIKLGCIDNCESASDITALLESEKTDYIGNFTAGDGSFGTSYHSFLFIAETTTLSDSIFSARTKFSFKESQIFTNDKTYYTDNHYYTISSSRFLIARVVSPLDYEDFHPSLAEKVESVINSIKLSQ